MDRMSSTWKSTARHSARRSGVTSPSSTTVRPRSNVCARKATWSEYASTERTLSDRGRLRAPGADSLSRAKPLERKAWGPLEEANVIRAPWTQTIPSTRWARWQQPWQQRNAGNVRTRVLPSRPWPRAGLPSKTAAVTPSAAPDHSPPGAASLYRRRQLSPVAPSPKSSSTADAFGRPMATEAAAMLPPSKRRSHERSRAVPAQPDSGT